MDACPYCGRKVSGLELSSRTRAARYHEDCRNRELGLPPEPWMPVRVALFLWEDAMPFLWNTLRSVWAELRKAPLGHAGERSPRDQADDAAMKHRDLWL